MDYDKLITERFSVRKFEDKPLSEEDVNKILHAGHVAPTGCNKQPQRILVINSDEAIAKLQKCTKCHFNTRTAFLVCHNEDESWVRPFDGALASPVDASIVATHMMLKAHEIGVGCCWVMYFEPDKLIKEFNIPSNIKPLAILVTGYPAADVEPLYMHNEKRPLEEVVSYNEF
ncbi:MAG: nitroreductase family protein [Kiritimatiellae bacterium]|nr:nitroreductase family protein [Kiritimatiellia bacterium]